MKRRNLVEGNRLWIFVSLYASLSSQYVPFRTCMLGLLFFSLSLFPFSLLFLSFPGSCPHSFLSSYIQTSWLWNVFMWLMLFFGTGLLMCLYSHEWYARMVRRVRKRREDEKGKMW